MLQSFCKYEIFVIFDAEDLTDDGLCIKIRMDRCILDYMTDLS